MHVPAKQPEPLPQPAAQRVRKGAAVKVEPAVAASTAAAEPARLHDSQPRCKQPAPQQAVSDDQPSSNQPSPSDPAEQPAAALGAPPPGTPAAATARSAANRSPQLSGGTASVIKLPDCQRNSAADKRQPSAVATAQKRHASNDVRCDDLLPSGKRQCRTTSTASGKSASPSAAAMPHQQLAPAAQPRASGDASDAAETGATLPGGFATVRRLLPGFQRNTDTTAAAKSDALARVNAHCIDAPAHHVFGTAR